MTKPKIRAFRLELAICLLVPLIVLLTISLVGNGLAERAKADVMAQFLVLDEVPLLATQLSAAQKCLGSFRMQNGGKENAEWSHRVSQGAAIKGVSVKAVNTEKVTPQAAVSCNDYRVHASGEGRLAAVVGWLDELDQPARCFKVAALKMRPIKMAPHFEYEVEGVVNARSIVMQSQPGQELPAQIEPAVAKLNALVVAVNALSRTKWKELDTNSLEARERSNAKEAVAPVILQAPLSLKLTGIVKDGHKPLALTDRGVVGEGEVIDGYRVKYVGIDHIVVENAVGKPETIRLYRTEGAP